jgi:hypothetical protein
MRFTIDVQRLRVGWSVRVLDPDDNTPMRRAGSQDPILAEPRVLDEVVIGETPYPLPPAGGPDALPNGLAAETLEQTFRAVMNQGGGGDAVRQFGAYLFSTLLGDALWAGLTEASPRLDEMELALTWTADSPLNLLPWDVMHAGPVGGPVGPTTGLLAAKGVQITRRVAGTAGADRRIPGLPSPPKVLVAVASELTDTRIRAGAEYLGLLRALKHENKVLNTRLIIAATAADLARTIKTFQPTVVHVIGHGVRSRGKPVVLFRGEPGEPLDDPVDAARLLELMRTEDNLELPGLVVLNACAPTAIDEVTVGRPMAAELVAGGIPVVVGMSGNVADQACRLFTRAFYTSLLSGAEIAKAAAIGRRAGILYGGYDIGKQIDWALPTLYMAEAVGAVSIDVNASDPSLARLLAALEFTKQPEFPIFCGRWAFFAAYRNLVSTDGKQFLVIPVERADATGGDQEPPPQYGSERLLRELAAEALREGHLPILVSKRWLEVKEHKWPGHVEDYVRLIALGLARTVAALAMVPKHEDLRELDFWKHTKWLLDAPPPGERLPKEFDTFGLSAEQKLAKALMLDLLDVRAAVSELSGLDTDEGADEDSDAGMKIVLLLEDFHDLLFGDTFLELFRGFGIGDARARKHIRAVMTYHTIPVTPQNTTIKAIEDFMQSADVDRLPLGPLHGVFGEKVSDEDAGIAQEAALVYRQFLLGWQFDKRATPLSVAARDDRDRLIMARIAVATRWGIPSELAGRSTSLFINGLRPPVIPELRDADDEDALDVDARRAKLAAAGGG